MIPCDWSRSVWPGGATCVRRTLCPAFPPAWAKTA